jgi:hypothetical protein
LLIFARLEHLDGMAGHDGRNRMLVDKLGMPVSPQQQTEIVEPRDNALELYAIDEENRERDFILPQVV